MTIGELGDKTELPVTTLRYYESLGLLPVPPRDNSGYRVYDATAVRLLGFVKSAKQVGFTLEEISEFQMMRITPGRTCGDIKHKALEKIQELEGRIRRLRQMKNALVTLTELCMEDVSIKECQILELMEKQS